jgi:hypothetical protein
MKTAALRSGDRRAAGVAPLRTAARAGLLLFLGLLLIRGSSPAAERSLASQAAPEFKEFQVLLPDSHAVARGELPVRDGDTVLIHTFWDNGAPYEVSADFRQIDSNGDSAVSATRLADRVVQVGGESETWSCYAIEYRISADNAFDDRSYTPVPITAHDPVSMLSTTTETVRFCLYNDLLEHRETRVIGDSARFIDRDGILCYRVRNGDEITLWTTWATRNRPMAIKPDFLQLDQFFTINDVTFDLIEEVSSDTLVTYQINYRLNRTAWPQDDHRPKYPVPVLIEGLDSECGVGFTTVYFEMDLTGPSGAPVFSPELPATAATAVLPVHGTAPEDARDVLLLVKHLGAEDPDSTTRVALDLDEDLRFSGEVPLLPGANKLTAYARDVVGNWSAASTVRTVKYVLELGIAIPQPFHPGDAFVFDSPAGWSRADVEIYNLEGDRIRSWTHQGAGGPLYEVNVPWDGRNGSGESVRQGPYLLRYRMADSAGRTALEEVKAFVLQK